MSTSPVVCLGSEFNMDEDKAAMPINTLLSFYSLRGLLLESHLYALGWPRWAMDVYRRRKKRVCSVCGRKEDPLFYFASLTPIWNEQKECIEYECSDHGGSCGKMICDAHTGGYQRISPTPPVVYRWFRNRLQDITLLFYYSVRFLSSFFRYLFWWGALSLARKIPSLVPVLRKMVKSECAS